MELIRDTEHFKVAISLAKKAQRGQNGKKKHKKKNIVFKLDGSLYALFSRFWEKLKVFLTSPMSGYLMNPIRDNYDFKEVVRNV